MGRTNKAVAGAHPRRRRASLAIATMLLNVLVTGLAAQAPAAGSVATVLPEGAGAEVLRARCLSCHGSELIVSQVLNEAGWGRELDKMVRWGATLTETDRPALLGYLSAHFAPAPVASHSRAAEGEVVFKRACLTCHGADLTEQQRLSPAGWTREVEKMMRWGATVSDVEKPALVDFLSTRHPAR